MYKVDRILEELPRSTPADRMLLVLELGRTPHPTAEAAIRGLAKQEDDGCETARLLALAAHGSPEDKARAAEWILASPKNRMKAVALARRDDSFDSTLLRIPRDARQLAELLDVMWEERVSLGELKLEIPFAHAALEILNRRAPDAAVSVYGRFGEVFASTGDLRSLKERILEGDEDAIQEAVKRRDESLIPAIIKSSGSQRWTTNRDEPIPGLAAWKPLVSAVDRLLREEDPAVLPMLVWLEGEPPEGSLGFCARYLTAQDYTASSSALTVITRSRSREALSILLSCIKRPNRSLTSSATQIACALASFDDREALAAAESLLDKASQARDASVFWFREEVPRALFPFLERAIRTGTPRVRSAAVSALLESPHLEALVSVLRNLQHLRPFQHQHEVWQIIRRLDGNPTFDGKPRMAPIAMDDASIKPALGGKSPWELLGGDLIHAALVYPAGAIDFLRPILGLLRDPSLKAVLDEMVAEGCARFDEFNWNQVTKEKKSALGQLAIACKKRHGCMAWALACSGDLQDQEKALRVFRWLEVGAESPPHPADAPDLLDLVLREPGPATAPGPADRNALRMTASCRTCPSISGSLSRKGCVPRPSRGSRTRWSQPPTPCSQADSG